MKLVGFIALMALLVPLQATVFHSWSDWGLRPDLCLVTVCLAGLRGGRAQGTGVGVVLGLIQDLFSASPLWLNLFTKTATGFLAGSLTRNLSNMESALVFFPIAALSFAWGIVFWLASRAGTEDMLHGALAILAPQALLDGLMAVGLNWIMARWAVTPAARDGWVRNMPGGVPR